MQKSCVTLPKNLRKPGIKRKVRPAVLRHVFRRHHTAGSNTIHATP